MIQIWIFTIMSQARHHFSLEIDLSKVLPAAKLEHGLNIYYKAAYAHGFPLLS